MKISLIIACAYIQPLRRREKSYGTFPNNFFLCTKTHTHTNTHTVIFGKVLSGTLRALSHTLMPGYRKRKSAVYGVSPSRYYPVSCCLSPRLRIIPLSFPYIYIYALLFLHFLARHAMSHSIYLSVGRDTRHVPPRWCAGVTHTLARGKCKTCRRLFLHMRARVYIYNLPINPISNESNALIQRSGIGKVGVSYSRPIAALLSFYLPEVYFIAERQRRG